MAGGPRGSFNFFKDIFGANCVRRRQRRQPPNPKPTHNRVLENIFSLFHLPQEARPRADFVYFHPDFRSCRTKWEVENPEFNQNAFGETIRCS